MKRAAFCGLPQAFPIERSFARVPLRMARKCRRNHSVGSMVVSSVGSHETFADQRKPSPRMCTTGPSKPEKEMSMSSPYAAMR